jgi:hypothetical protein
MQKQTITNIISNIIPAKYQKECLREFYRLNPCKSSEIIFATSTGEIT